MTSTPGVRQDPASGSGVCQGPVDPVCDRVQQTRCVNQGAASASGDCGRVRQANPEVRLERNIKRTQGAVRYVPGNCREGV